MSRWNYGVDKTYRTASESFRDADYATPIWKCETDKDRAIRYLKDGTIFLVLGVVGVITMSFITHIRP